MIIMNKTLLKLLHSEGNDETLKITYGNDEILKLNKNEKSVLIEDGWLIVNSNNNVEYIKIDSIYKITTIPNEYIYAIIPTANEVSKQILEILSDNKEYKTRDVKKLLVHRVVLSEENGKKLSKVKLKEKMDWISSFEISKLKKGKFIESKHYGCLNITSKGLDKLNNND